MKAKKWAFEHPWTALLDWAATTALLIGALVAAWYGLYERALLACIAHSLWCIELRIKIREDAE